MIGEVAMLCHQRKAANFTDFLGDLATYYEIYDRNPEYHVIKVKVSFERRLMKLIFKYKILSKLTLLEPLNRL